jgi:5'-nucleotidase
VHYTHHFAQALLRKQLPFDVDVLKIDIPGDATPETPWRMTRLSRQPYYHEYQVKEQPADETLVRLDYDVRIDWETLEQDSDIYAFAHDRVVSVTPLSLDLTSRTSLVRLGRLLRRGVGEKVRDKGYHP